LTLDHSGRRRRRRGFTLIEVIGALLIFSVGVIMLLQITNSLAERLEWAALNSLITAEGRERLDSLDALDYTSLPVATDIDTLSFRGISYRLTQQVTQFTALVRRAQVTLQPLGTAEGPTFQASVFSSGAW
jgi:prepilin-type N-terminal cleavage/methylation domain-containing protein